MIGRQHRLLRAATDQVVQTSQRLLPEATEGTYYSFQLECVGLLPNETATWQLAPDSVALPPGLTLSTSGLISGTPTVMSAGSLTYQFLVDVIHAPV